MEVCKACADAAEVELLKSQVELLRMVMIRKGLFDEVLEIDKKIKQLRLTHK
jgi:hypothetical protein